MGIGIDDGLAPDRQQIIIRIDNDQTVSTYVLRMFKIPLMHLW